MPKIQLEPFVEHTLSHVCSDVHHFLHSILLSTLFIHYFLYSPSIFPFARKKNNYDERIYLNIYELKVSVNKYTTIQLDAFNCPNTAV